VAAKHDSQEICFVPNGDYAGFLAAWLRDRGGPEPPAGGAIVTAAGRQLGTHEGVHHFTVGQRRGLGVAAGEPLYVIATRPETREVVVGTNDELLRSTFCAKDLNWISIAGADEPVRAQVKIRNRHEAAAATIRAAGDPSRVEVTFDQPQRAVAPGQGAVFYDGELVLGGGWIE
jgi:tRNA-specific 2-thiouridylase